MNIYRKDELNSIPNSIACIGYFDGVHIGHQELIKRTIELSSKEGVVPFIITFYPDPESVIFNRNITELCSLERRFELFEEYGIKNCLLLDFDSNLMNLSSLDFIKQFILNSNIKKIVCGRDFRFGKNALGNVEVLKEYIDVDVLDDVLYEDIKVSSSYIRELINTSNVELAYKLLGHE